MRILLCCLFLVSCSTNKYSTNKTKQKLDKIINNKTKNMSTTFGIPQRQIELDKLVDEDGDLHDYIDTSFFDKVFFRSMSNSRWMNSLAERLPEDTRVFPLDNTAQGVYTIKDCKEILKKQYDR